MFSRKTAAQSLALRRSQVAAACFPTIGSGSPFHPAHAGARGQSGTASIGFAPRPWTIRAHARTLFRLGAIAEDLELGFAKIIYLSILVAMG